MCAPAILSHTHTHARQVIKLERLGTVALHYINVLYLWLSVKTIQKVQLVENAMVQILFAALGCTCHTVVVRWKILGSEPKYFTV